MPRANDVAFLAGLAAGALPLVALGLVGAAPLAAHGDFAELWAGSRVVLDGGSPYDPSTWPSSLASVARSTPVDVYVYPPVVALLLVPLALLPLPTAAAVWTIGGVLLAALATRALCREVVPDAPAVHALAAFSVLASGPALVALSQGQWDPLLLAALAYALVAVRRGHGGRAGAALAFALVKPQVLLLGALALARAALARGGDRVVVAGAGALALVAASAVALPSWWLAWGDGALAGFVVDRPTRAATLAATLASIAGSGGVLVAAIAIVVGVGIALRLDPRGDEWLAVWPALSLVAAPYAQAYDALLLVAPLVVATGLLARRGGASAFALAWWTLLGPVAMAAYALTVADGVDRYGALVPLAALGLAAYAIRSRTVIPAARGSGAAVLP